MVALLAASVLTQPVFQMNYNGGSISNNINNNPFLMNKLLNKLNTANQAFGSCLHIQGIGLPVLAIKKMLIFIDDHLDANNQHSFAKIIYFSEKVSPQGLVVTLILKFYTFSEKFYIGLSGLLKAKGLPRFQLNNYHYSNVLAKVATSLAVENVDENNFVTCGEVKTIYTNYLRSMRTDQTKLFNIPAGTTSYNYKVPSSFGQPATFYQQPTQIGPFVPYT